MIDDATRRLLDNLLPDKQWGYLDASMCVTPCSFAEILTRGVSDPFRDPTRIMAKDSIGCYLVSTVFIPLDMGWPGKPLWFETMIFDANGDRHYSERYETHAEAMRGHAEAVEMANGWAEENARMNLPRGENPGP